MATLVLKLEGKELGAYGLQEGKSLSVGRKEGNDVVISHITVSGNHAKIDALSEGYLLSDLRSKNGTKVNGSRIGSSCWLVDGDEIGIGTHVLVFSVSGDEEAFGFKEERTHDATAVLDTDDLMK